MASNCDMMVVSFSGQDLVFDMVRAQPNSPSWKNETEDRNHITLGFLPLQDISVVLRLVVSYDSILIKSYVALPGRMKAYLLAAQIVAAIDIRVALLARVDLPQIRECTVTLEGPEIQGRVFDRKGEVSLVGNRKRLHAITGKVSDLNNAT